MSSRPLSTENEIRVRAVAHALWVEEGMPVGRAETHWLKAIEIVMAQATETAAAATPTRKASATVAAPKKAAAAAKKAAPRKRG